MIRANPYSCRNGNFRNENRAVSTPPFTTVHSESRKKREEASQKYKLWYGIKTEMTIIVVYRRINRFRTENEKYFVSLEAWPYGKDNGPTMYYIEKFITKLLRSRTEHARPAIVWAKRFLTALLSASIRKNPRFVKRSPWVLNIFDKFVYNFFWLFSILIVNARARAYSTLLFGFLVHAMI